MHVQLLDRIPMFAGLSGDEKWNLARLITVRDLAAGQHVFWIGDTGDEFFVVASGKIEITYPDENGREMTLAVLGTGAFFGEVALLDGGTRTATARARTDVSLLCLGRDAFHKFVAECPSAAIHVMTAIGRRQRETVDKLRGIRNLNEVMAEQLSAWQRVANVIASLAASRNFLMVHAAAVIGWIILNLSLGKDGPDPYPFAFLCFWSSTEAIFLSLFILISQNVQGQKDRMRTELEYQVALKAQYEITQLHRKLDELTAVVVRQSRGQGDEDGDEVSAETEPARSS